MKKIIFAVLLVVSSGAMAETYRAETDLSYVGKDNGYGGGYDGLNFRGTYYFSAVDDSNGPLAEAAFISRNSSVFGLLGYGNPRHGDVKVVTYGLGATYINDIGLLFGAHYMVENYNDVHSEDQSDFDDIQFQFGTYVADTGLLTFDFNVTQATQVDGDEEDANLLAVNYKHLLQFKNEAALALDARFAYTNFEDEDAYDLRSLTLGGDYYFNAALSLGLLGGVISSDSSQSGYRYGANAKYYFNSHIGLSVSAERVDGSDGWYEMTTYGLGVMGRF